MTQPVSLRDYWQMLRDHDWEYEHNDDPQAWHQAHAERHRLIEITRQSRDHDVLYSVALAWSLGRCPLPPQPEAEAA